MRITLTTNDGEVIAILSDEPCRDTEDDCDHDGHFNREALASKGVARAAFVDGILDFADFRRA